MSEENQLGKIEISPTAIATLAAHAVCWGDLDKLDAARRAHYRRWFTWAKEQRAYSDFYRYYQVSNVFPVPDGVSSRDYRHAIPAERYGVPPTGIHPPAFDPASVQRGEFFDGVARLDERKGHRLVIAALDDSQRAG